MNKRAFTLIELLIVLAIAAIIAGALVPVFSASKQDAKIAKLLALADTLRSACERYYFDTGEYAQENSSAPEDCSQAANRRLSCDSGVSGWNGPYINQPLVSEDNPFGSGIFVNNVLGAAFDLDGDGSPDREGQGNLMYIFNTPEAIAKRINDIVDASVLSVGDEWKTEGKVVYLSGHTGFYLYGGSTP